MTMHFPAHESLEEFATRTKRSVAAAYDDWHDRPYPAFTAMRDMETEFGGRVRVPIHHEHRGPGLGIRR